MSQLERIEYITTPDYWWANLSDEEKVAYKIQNFKIYESEPMGEGKTQELLRLVRMNRNPEVTCISPQAGDSE